MFPQQRIVDQPFGWFLRSLLVATAWIVVLAQLTSGTALAQDSDGDEDAVPAERRSYGDVELIETLRSYGLIDQWIDASPVTPAAALLEVSGGSSYQQQRQAFLDALNAWGARTEAVRARMAQIDETQAATDLVRSMITQVWEALVFDDRLATDSNTLREIEDALAQLDGLERSEGEPVESEDPLLLAEAQLGNLHERATAELQALNGVEPAFTSSGISAFVGFDGLRLGLNEVDLRLVRARELVRPAQEQSEQLLSRALSQLPALHFARMLGTSDVGGMTVVTVDAYVRAADRAACSVDWALLAGIGQIESNHGRIEGASVSRTGQVSTTILGPLLDGGETETGPEFAATRALIAEALQAVRTSAFSAFDRPLWGWPQGPAGAGATDDFFNQGNGFAIVLDSDGGALDGNDEWDRAVGPMQFLPETWSRWAIDGNGDGVSDPHNLYDAAATAARFLCDLSRSRGSAPSSFVLGYNSSTSYVRNVLSTAQALRSGILPGR